MSASPVRLSRISDFRGQVLATLVYCYFITLLAKMRQSTAGCVKVRF